MKDTFHMGYNLQLAGFDFAAVNQKSDHNIALLSGIAEDFVKASDHKPGSNAIKKKYFTGFTKQFRP